MNKCKRTAAHIPGTRTDRKLNELVFFESFQFQAGYKFICIENK